MIPGLGDPVKKEMATHSNILAWRNPWREEPGGLQSMGSQRVGHNLAIECTHTHILYAFLLPTALLLWFSHSVMSNSVTPQTATHQATLSFTISQSLLKLMSIESVMPSNHLILCGPLLFLPSMVHSIRVFSRVNSSYQVAWRRAW